MKPSGLLIIFILVTVILCLSRYAGTFMPTVIINLDRSPDRLFQMTLQCYLYGIPFHRHPAVDGNTHIYTDKEKQTLFGLALRRQTKIDTSTFKHTPEERIKLYETWETQESFKKTRRIMACSLSHFQVWERYKNTTDPYIIVLEDDGKINSHFRQQVNTSITHLNTFDPNWDIMWLSGKDPEDREQVAHWNSYAVYRMDPPKYIGQGAGAYILSRKGIKYFLKVLEEKGCSDGADFFLLNNLILEHGYGIHPPLVDIHSSGPSTIVL